MDKKQKNKYTSIGGQAVIEGIMMKGPDRSVLACRRPDKQIMTEEIKTSNFKEKYKIFKLPLLRGVSGFIEAMALGYKILMRSAEVSTSEEFGAAPDEAVKTKEKDSSVLFGFIMAIASVLGIGLALFLFMWVPTQLFNLTRDNINFGSDISKLRALFEGIIKIFMFVGYISLVSLMKDIKRVFMYHGAEHKTIFCYEAKLPLTVENIKKQTRLHPRCGTSFMFLMIAVGIVFSTSVVLLFPELTKSSWIWVVVKILMIPLFCAFGYEILKLCGKHDNIFTRVVSAPGKWVQKITTKEPTDDIIEVSIAAMNGVIPADDPCNTKVLYDVSKDEATEIISSDTAADEIINGNH